MTVNTSLVFPIISHFQDKNMLILVFLSTLYSVIVMDIVRVQNIMIDLTIFQEIKRQTLKILLKHEIYKVILLP